MNNFIFEHYTPYFLTVRTRSFFPNVSLSSVQVCVCVCVCYACLTHSNCDKNTDGTCSDNMLISWKHHRKFKPAFPICLKMGP